MSGRWRTRALVVIGLVATSAASVASGLEDATVEAIRRQIEELAATGAGGRARIAGGERVHAVRAVQEFYEQRGYRPAWNLEGRNRRMARELQEAIAGAHRHGLIAADYHQTAIKERLATFPDPRGPDQAPLAASLDILLSETFMIYGSHLLAGRVNPETIDDEWVANRRGANFAALLDRALSEDGVANTLERLAPTQPGYAWLCAALAGYRELEEAGGWKPVPPGGTLRRDDADPRVERLRARLAAEGYLPLSGELPSEQAMVFDNEVEEEVRRFQHRHGLDIDGAVGRATLQALNVPVAERVRQIRLNLERWRWLPDDLGERHVRVNIAGFTLEVWERREVLFEMRAIVGRLYRRTPSFSDRITYIVLNPAWNVPHKLAVQDVLPEIKKNPTYLTERGFDVFGGWGVNAIAIDPTSIDWAEVTASAFPYRLRQRPGPMNALGRIKFMFPNKFSVYLHDTPGRALFQRPARAASSGCIRIEEPIDLAEFMLQDDPRWSRAAILAAIEAGTERTVTLSEPMPIHLLYWTAWADSGGAVHFREDLYERDPRLVRALDDDPPE